MPIVHGPLFPNASLCANIFVFGFINMARMSKRPGAEHVVRHPLEWFRIAFFRNLQNVDHLYPSKQICNNTHSLSGKLLRSGCKLWSQHTDKFEIKHSSHPKTTASKVPRPRLSFQAWQQLLRDLLLNLVSLGRGVETPIQSSPKNDGRNSAAVDMVKYPVIYKVLDISTGDRRISEPSTVCFDMFCLGSMMISVQVSSSWWIRAPFRWEVVS